MTKTTPLSTMCELVVDCPHFTPTWTDSGYIVTRNQNIRNGRLDLSSPSFTNAEDFRRRIARAKPQAGDLIFTREAPMGEVCMIPEGLTCCLGQRQVLLRPAKDVDALYLLYALQSPFVRHQILWNEGTGSTVSNVRIPNLKALNIPRYGSQEPLIGVLLGTLDDKIDLNRRTNETLEAMARAVFKSWFVDFDPVHAKAAGKAPAHMDAETAALFPDTLGDDGLPVGWRFGTVGDVANLNASSWTAKKAPSELWYVDLANAKIGVIEEVQHFSWPDAPSRARRILSEGDTIVGTVRPGNRSFAFIGRMEQPLTGSTGFAVLTPKAAHYREFTYCACTSDETIDHLAHVADGGAYPAVRPDVVAAVECVVPPVAVAEAFSQFTAPLFDKLTLNLNENKTLAALRDLLLPKLMSGELRLREAENKIKEAVL